MRQAITTKYLGPTNHRGARVKASAQAGSVTVGWDHALGVDQNHQAAARALVLKYGWAGDWHVGATTDGTGNVYVKEDGDGFSVSPVLCQNRQVVL